MSPTHDLPRHRFGLLLLGLPPRVPVQIFQNLAVLPHVCVDPCRAHFLVAVQHLPPYDLLPSSSVAIPARSSLTTAPAPSDESRGVLVLRKCLGQHPLPRAQLLVSLPRAPFRALARAGQSTPRLTSECHCSYGSLIVRIRNGMLRVSATIYSASMARSRQEPHQHRGLAGRIASSRSLAHEAGTSSPSAMWSQLTIRTVSRSESVACGTTMKPCMRPRQGQNPRRTVRVMPLPQEPCARCSLCVGARPLWIAWCRKAALAGMGRCTPHTVTSTLHLATHLSLWQMIDPYLIAERSASPSAPPCALPLDYDDTLTCHHASNQSLQSLALPPTSIPLHNLAKHTLCIDTITNTHPLLPTMS